MTPSIEEPEILTNPSQSAYNFNQDHRCPVCGKLLAVGKITMGHLEIKCTRAKCAAVIKISQHGDFLV